MSNVRKLYTDGGCIGQNPSPLGGTWAWCGIDDAGEMVADGSGTISPASCGLPTVSNNVAELMAMVEALSAVPVGWNGIVFTDSLITLNRAKRPGLAGMNGVPQWMRQRVMNIARTKLGIQTDFDTVKQCEFILLGGHPTERELKDGFRSDGKPVSYWNVWCDQQCNAQLNKYEKEHGMPLTPWRPPAKSGRKRSKTG